MKRRNGHAKIRTWDLRLIRALSGTSYWYVFWGVVFHRLNPFFAMFERFRGMYFLEIFARLEIAKNYDLIDENKFNFLWVTDFPLLEFDEEENRYVAKHHPFTAPMDEDVDTMMTNPAAARAKAYDLVINGNEAGGGSIRIHSSDLQEKMFEALGFSKEAANDRFGHMIEAFSYGAPPHGGLAFGLDRLVMLLAGTDSIRDVIAFPKVQNASEIMMASPDFVEDIQLTDLHIAVTGSEE